MPQYLRKETVRLFESSIYALGLALVGMNLPTRSRPTAGRFSNLVFACSAASPMRPPGVDHPAAHREALETAISSFRAGCGQGAGRLAVCIGHGQRS